jgi:peptidoglycan hydrolase CwlO-like protein
VEKRLNQGGSMKKDHVCLILTVILLFFGGFGCKADEVSEAEKAAFKTQVSTELNKLATKISQIESKVSDLNRKSKEEATVILTELQEKQKKIHNEIEKIQKAPGAHWDEVKVETKELLSDLQASYDQAVERLP